MVRIPKNKVEIPKVEVIGVYEIPAWAVCYLVYGDKGGLSDEDVEMVDNFLKKENLTRCGIDVVTEEYCEFNSCPAFGLACDTYTVRFTDLAGRRYA